VPVDGLVQRLLLLIEEGGQYGESQENARRVLACLLEGCGRLCFGEQFLRQISSGETVDMLVDHLLGGEVGGRARTAGRILSCVVTAICPARGSPSADSPRTNPPSSPEVVAPRVAEGPDGWIEQHAVEFLERLCEHLPRVAELLEVGSLAGFAVDRSKTLRLQQGTVRVAGGTLIELVGLVNNLVRTGRPQILQALGEAQLLRICMESMLAHPWCCLLHNACARLASDVLTVACTASPMAGIRLVLGLLRDGFGERIVAEYAEDGKRNEDGSIRRGRVGYMGQLHTLVRELCDFCAAVPECGSALFSVEGWFSVVMPAVKLAGRLHAADLASPNFALEFCHDVVLDGEELFADALGDSALDDSVEASPPGSPGLSQGAVLVSRTGAVG
jgi:hypothetical protein